MMTFNEKHHLVFPQVPTACACAKLDEYFGELRKAEIEALQTQGDFGGEIWRLGRLWRPKSKIGGKMGKFKAVIPGMKDTVRNSLLQVAKTISGCVGCKNDFGNLKEIGKLFHREGDFGNMQSSEATWEISKMWLILKKGKG